MFTLLHLVFDAKKRKGAGETKSRERLTDGGLGRAGQSKCERVKVAVNDELVTCSLAFLAAILRILLCSFQKTDQRWL